MADFVHQLHAERIQRAIAAAERQTSGELRVVIHRGRVEDPLAAAKAEFARLEMHLTRERNAVLIFVAPASHAFALYGDEAVHAKCGQAFWDELAATMTEHFKRAAFTDGLVLAIDRAGALLAQHFPRRPDDRNELPDDVIDRGTVI